MKPLENTIYEMDCCICDSPFDYKLYDSNGVVHNKYDPYCVDKKFKVIESHGVCKPCLPVMYMRTGLLVEYKEMKKNMWK